MTDKWTVESPWLELHCALGEGPFYEKAAHAIRFVDIKKKQVHTVSLDQGLSSLQTIQLDVCPTVTSDIQGVDPRERILLGVKHGVAILHRETGTYEMLARFGEPDNERLRSNDGACDPHGRFWLGSMTDFGLGEMQPEGSLFRFSHTGRDDEVMKGLTIPNSVGWSPDGRAMYFTHSKARQILAWDYDPSSGALARQRLFYQHAGHGEPDGFRIDVDGNLWSAVYGEGLVLKISPRGDVIGRVTLPTRNVTCVQFAGTELVITSAADEAEDADSVSRRHGGAVFRVDVGTRGLELFEFVMGPRRK
ncbi:SMP-30/Gluconolaconase/LRE-like domain-containing protein [Hirsutella rhossiliensis]|uniref:SMP-30/Gluconolaconase/LRE-like domain-containing protein n=1 Tax=Hirsutella rhossiliensis TaxID=111463 RepID=A0A9P8N544_9HYPO|nr:SMP-30/Gluconolaconase/LRE-like domain-containing protein [Hirsutella rhossiliensis]KAH0965954.1 SMP-30/Gluconolaconase/LRE-like domain-containing protein [Hirsutella rhossiliensis]